MMIALRILLLPESDTNMSPMGLTTTPRGWFKVAAVAALPSPENDAAVPLPTTVWMVPTESICNKKDTRNQFGSRIEFK